MARINRITKGNTFLGLGLFGFFGLFGVIVLVIVGLFVAQPFLSHGTKDTAVVTVEDKERVVKNDDSYYLVWTDVQNEDGSETSEVFKVTDDFFQGKFNASDTYGQLDIGGTYEVTVNGFRIGLISEYRNILSVDGVVNEG